MDNLNAQMEGDKNRLVKNKLAEAAIWLKNESLESLFFWYFWYNVGEVLAKFYVLLKQFVSLTFFSFQKFLTLFCLF